MPANKRTKAARTTKFYPRGRAVEAMAIDLLRSRGYTVIRSTRSSHHVHLVAWCDRARPVFLHVKRTRRACAGVVDVASIWRADIEALKVLPRWDDMSVQFWIYTVQKGWSFFEIFPGGIAEVDGRVA